MAASDAESDESNNGIDWTSEEEDEVNARNTPFSPPSLRQQVIRSPAEACSSSGSSSSKVISQFVAMGFLERNVVKTIEKFGYSVGEENEDSILDSLLKYSGIENSPHECQRNSPAPSPNGFVNIADDLSDVDSSLRIVDKTNESLEKDEKLALLMDMGYPTDEAVTALEKLGSDAQIVDLAEFISAAQMEKEFDAHVGELPNEDERMSYSNIKDDAKSAESLEKDMMLSILVEMGYPAAEAFTAIEMFGPDAQIAELTDYICAARMEKEFDAQLGELPHEDNKMSCFSDIETSNQYFLSFKKRKLQKDDTDRQKSRKVWGSEKNLEHGNIDVTHLPNPMIGFGIPDRPLPVIERRLPKTAAGPPYFYYENVAFTPKGVWSDISRFLFDTKPEFVDSMYFCAAMRKRGYIHNLPIHNRFPLEPRPPLTIHEALPSTRQYWPSWDPRRKLNCLLTCIGSAQLTDRIRKALEKYDGEPPLHVQKYVLGECRKWNMVWVGRNKVAPLEPGEMEKMMGFPVNHTRGITRADRYKALGNAFQVDTVAYHLSVLKKEFPDGINVLSLFSGIGGAEVALHRLGICLKNVVSIEISEINRTILKDWWENTKQSGNLIELADVQEVTGNMLGEWISSFGGFDLVIGGSPCNNLAGGNRVSRAGLSGEHSSLFFEYIRILDLVRELMGCL